MEMLGHKPNGIVKGTFVTKFKHVVLKVEQIT